jgi:hypothetical protein
MTEFGKDTSCTTEIRSGRIVTGVRLVAEAAYRRLTTKRGLLRGGPGENNYGIDLADYCGVVATPNFIAGIPSEVENELLKDQRILSAETRVLVESIGPAVYLRLFIKCVTAEGPFTLQVGVDELSTQLLGIES